jgi:hypothetical protein
MLIRAIGGSGLMTLVESLADTDYYSKVGLATGIVVRRSRFRSLHAAEMECNQPQDAAVSSGLMVNPMFTCPKHAFACMWWSEQRARIGRHASHARHDLPTSVTGCIRP